MRYVDTQTILIRQAKGPDYKEISSSFPWSSCEERPRDSSDDSFMWPDECSTRILRKAGKLIPRERKGKHFNSLLCSRQALTAWFKKRDDVEGGWIGIILVDPPFRLPRGNTYSIPTIYRSFSRRPSILDEPEDDKDPSCTRETLAQHIRTRFQNNAPLLKAANGDPFIVLGDTYRLVASKWIVINEYINRELATAEYILEKEEPSFRDLEVYLKDLYVHRRRVTRYYELITEAKEQCSRRGQKSWSSSPPSKLALEHSADVEGDFVFLQAKIERTAQRIEKNISLLTALVAIGAGKQGLDENRGMTRLSLLAAIFLPFSTVAAILSMQGNYAPGQSAFWVFWAVAVPLWASIVSISMLYNGAWRAILFKRK